MYVNEDPYILIKDNKAELICDELLFPYHYFFYKNLIGDDFQCYLENKKTIIKPACSEIDVCSNSPNKEGIYKFLDYIFDSNNYYKYSMSNFDEFPALKLNEEDWKLIITSEEKYTDRYGNKKNPTDMDFTMGTVNYNLKSFSEEEYEDYEEFIHSAEYIEPMPDKYLDIILEEANFYFDDEKSLDDTVKAIENRVTTALNE